ERIETKLTPTGKKLLLKFVADSGLTVSEILEQVARGIFNQSDRRLINFLSRCADGERIEDLEIVELGHDLEIDVQLLCDLRECLIERSKKNAVD
ncbi:MAG TPA: hypothetical protein V6C65_21255, partial [Allocoleopsis sp.]